MSVEFTLDAELRTDKGKGASRRLRRTDKVPGIIYGGGEEPQSITLSHNQVAHRLENEAFYSHIITLNLDGKSQEAVLRDLQRHPAKESIMHMDFQRVRADQAITVLIPLHFINENMCAGVKQQGGLVGKIITEVEISCLPKDIPEFIDIDIAELHVGEAIHMSEIQLPEGVKLAANITEDYDPSVVTVQMPRAEVEEEPVEGVEGIDAEGEAPAEAKPDEPKDDDEASS